MTDLIHKLVHLDDHETLSSEYSNLTSIAKSAILKRLNKFEVVHENNESYDNNFDNSNENNSINTDKNEHRRTLYNEAQKHPKRHLDRAHSRRLNAENLKSVVKNIQNHESMDNLSVKYELVLLGLKAKIEHYKQLAVELINKISKVDYLKNLYNELALNDYNLAVKVYSKQVGKYVSTTKQLLENILRSVKNNNNKE